MVTSSFMSMSMSGISEGAGRDIYDAGEFAVDGPVEGESASLDSNNGGGGGGGTCGCSIRKGKVCARWTDRRLSSLLKLKGRYDAGVMLRRCFWRLAGVCRRDAYCVEIKCTVAYFWYRVHHDTTTVRVSGLIIVVLPPPFPAPLVRHEGKDF
jgi:hypothetical protein